MRVAIYSDNFYPELSGISDSVILLAKNLAKRGHQIDFFAPHYAVRNFKIANLEPIELDLGENIKIHRLFSIPFPAPTKQGRLVIPTLKSWFYFKKNLPDIIHTQDFFGAGIEALITARFLKIPLIGTSHTPITEFVPKAVRKNRLLRDACLHFVSWYYNRCEYVTAPSNGILEEMKTYGFKKPSHSMSNPIQLDDFFSVPEAERQKLKHAFSLSNRTVLYTGRLAVEKHVDVLIRAVAIALKDFPDISLAITGGGSAEASLKQLAKKLKIEDKVRFFGIVDSQKHIEIYQASDIFVMPSTAETQSLSVMKGMAVKIPVIGVKAWGLKEYINDNVGFLLEPGDYEGIAQKIIFLFKNPDQAKKLGQGGYVFVQNFSEKNITDKWEKLYSDIIKNFKSKKI